MPFREKTAWISLVSFVLIYGLYFWRVADAGFAGMTGGNFLFSEGLVGSVVMLIIVQIVLNTVIAARAPKDASAPMDERERMISLRAMRNAFTVTNVLLFLGCIAAGFGVPPFLLGNGLFFILVMGEVVHAASQIAYYRMDA